MRYEQLAIGGSLSSSEPKHRLGSRGHKMADITAEIALFNQHGFSQPEFSRATGTSSSQAHDYLTGKRTLVRVKTYRKIKAAADKLRETGAVPEAPKDARVENAKSSDTQDRTAAPQQSGAIADLKKAIRQVNRLAVECGASLSVTEENMLQAHVAVIVK